MGCTTFGQTDGVEEAGSPSMVALTRTRTLESMRHCRLSVIGSGLVTFDDVCVGYR